MAPYTPEYLEHYRMPYADRAYTHDSWIRANIIRMGGGRGRRPKPPSTQKLFPWQFLTSEMESRGATHQAIRKQLEVRALAAIK